MGFLDMFDKLDDIIYKPVEAICDWVEEPLRKWEHGRNEQMQENMLKLQAEIEMEREEQAAKLQFQREQWDIEINKMIAEQEDAHRDRLVESIKNYQIQLANASRDIVESIGVMSINLRRKANDLVLEKTREYKKLQDEAKQESVKALLEAKENFCDGDQETYRILVDDIMQERRSMVETAGKCITELSEDLKRLNENTDFLMRQGMKAVEDNLKPMARAMGGLQCANVGNMKKLENADQDEKDTIEADYIEV